MPKRYPLHRPGKAEVEEKSKPQRFMIKNDDLTIYAFYSDKRGMEFRKHLVGRQNIPQAEYWQNSCIFCNKTSFKTT